MGTNTHTHTHMGTKKKTYVSRHSGMLAEIRQIRMRDIHKKTHTCTHARTYGHKKNTHTRAGIPACSPKSGKSECMTFTFAPAPWNEYIPDKDYPEVADFHALLLTS